MKQRNKICRCGKLTYTGRCHSCANKDRNGISYKETIGYYHLHRWILKRKPKPTWCELCFSRKPYDLANISGEYKRDINDFKWICRKCHMLEDGRLEKLNKYNRSKNGKKQL